MTKEDYEATIAWQANEIRRAVEMMTGLGGTVNELRGRVAQLEATIKTQEANAAAAAAVPQPPAPERDATPAPATPVAAANTSQEAGDGGNAG